MSESEIETKVPYQECPDVPPEVIEECKRKVDQAYRDGRLGAPMYAPDLRPIRGWDDEDPPK